MSKDYVWTVYDVLNEQSIGTWQDISAAQEFLSDNQAEEDIWTVMPAIETLETITIN